MKPVVIQTAEARALFDATPYLYSLAEVESTEQRCWALGGVAVIDWLEDAGRWAFHTMYLRDSVSKRPDLAAFFKNDAARYGEERKMEDAICGGLKERRVRWERQKRCGAGIADIVTDTRVCELKTTISFQSLAQAIGQVLIYAACIGGGRRPTVIGVVTDQRLFSLAQLAGVDLLDVDEVLSSGLN